MTLPGPTSYQYDSGLGIDCGQHVNYIKESHVVQSRISSTRCYLLRRKLLGTQQGDLDSKLPVVNYVETSPNYRAQIWPSGALPYPNVNPEVNNQEGAIQVYIDGVLGSRVIEVVDIAEDNEYCIVERKDRSDGRVEIVFNEAFNPTLHSIELIYTDINEDISHSFLKRGDSDNQSLHGWLQYINNCYNDFQDMHQVLVRMPLVTRDLIINEEGKVTLEEKDSWMIWEPYVRDFDILVIPSSESPTGVEMRFEVVNKRDSIIQRNLVSQRFKLKYLELSDERYDLPIDTDTATFHAEIWSDFGVSHWIFINITEGVDGGVF